MANGDQQDSTHPDVGITKGRLLYHAVTVSYFHSADEGTWMGYLRVSAEAIEMLCRFNNMLSSKAMWQIRLIKVGAVFAMGVLFFLLLYLFEIRTPHTAIIDIKRLMAKYNIDVRSVDCSVSSGTLKGSCSFTIDKKSMPIFREAFLNRYFFPVRGESSRIGPEKCENLDRSWQAYTVDPQPGDVSGTWIYSTYYNQDTGNGCFEIEIQAGAPPG